MTDHDDHTGHDHAGHDHAAHGHQHTLSYEDTILLMRAQNDEAMRTDERSPLLPEDRAGFAGVPYFPVDAAWAIDGLRLEPWDGDGPARWEFSTTDGKTRPIERAGVLRFSLLGVPQRLTAFRDPEEATQPGEPLFVPFLDGTTGTESYGAGRYLSIEADEDGTYTLDFNLAYHPSCVYNPRYSCVRTPEENRLTVRVEAGERLAEGDAH